MFGPGLLGNVLGMKGASDRCRWGPQRLGLWGWWGSGGSYHRDKVGRYWSVFGQVCFPKLAGQKFISKSSKWGVPGKMGDFLLPETPLL